MCYSTWSGLENVWFRISVILDIGRQKPKNDQFSQKRCAITLYRGSKVFGFELFSFWVPGGKTLQTIILHINGVTCSTQSELKSDRLRISLILDTGRKNPKNNHFSQKTVCYSTWSGLENVLFRISVIFDIRRKKPKNDHFHKNGVL